MTLFTLGLLTGFILTYFIQKAYRWFIKSDELDYHKFVQKSIKTVIKNQN